MIKSQFLSLGKFSLRSGNQLRFWKDHWHRKRPFSVQYPSLYNIVRHKSATVQEVMSTCPLNVSFRRALVGDKVVAWQNLVAKVASVQLQGGNDIFRWGLHTNGRFSNSSLYHFLIQDNIIPQHNKL